MTFGSPAEYPETGFGYIKTKKQLFENASSSRIEKFIEKPNLAKASLYVKDKHFSWNCGIFLFKASVILNEIKKFEKCIFQICRDSINVSKIDLDFQRIDKNIFFNCPNLSLDIAVMEKTELGLMILLKSDWKDIGSWNKVLENSNKDNNGNVLKGRVISKNVKNSYIRSESRLLVGVGLKDIIIVETSDATLIIDRFQTQEVKRIVEELIVKGFKEGKEHKKIYRPWGNYYTLVEDSNWQVKKIVVNPKQSLSLQMHNFRAEHWVVVKGKAEVEIDGKVSILTENQSTYIPIKSKHRLRNPDSLLLVLIEVQSGSQIDENDIIRFEDYYGRI